MRARYQDLIGALPRGGAIAEAQWRSRHRVLAGLLVAHVPALVVFALVAGFSPGHAVVEVVPLLLALGVGLRARSRTVASISITVGLVLASSVLVHLSGGLVEAHFHFLAMLGFIGLYHDWRPLLSAIGYVVLHHGVVGVLAPETVYNHPSALANPWLWAGVHGAFVALACVGIVLLWKATEREQEQARVYYRQLYEGEHALAQELEEAQRLKAELLGVVSHEFRTPLTGILGFAHTLSTRIDDLDPTTAQTCAEAIERQARRLSRLVQNLLAASGGIGAGAGSRDLGPIISALVVDLAEERGLQPTAAQLVGELEAEISHDAAYLLVGNLVDNAYKFALPGTPVDVRCHRDGDEVVLEVCNAAHELEPGEIERLFEAFVQADSSDTRHQDGLGLGLSVVHRLARAHGGRVEARSEDGEIVFTVRLPAAVDRVPAVTG